MQDTLETQLVASQGGNGLSEKLFGVFVSSVHTADVDLFPFNGDVVCLENSLD